MSQYYYLAASLPFLSYDDAAGAEPEHFLEDARRHLNPADMAALESARIDGLDVPGNGASVLDEWRRYDFGLRNELARARASQRSEDPAVHVRTTESGEDFVDISGIADTVREAVAQESPLAGEHALSRARWRCLDEMEAGHYFDMGRLILHYLKLQLLARKSRFDREAGESSFRSATEKIMQDYYQEQGEL